MPPQLALIIVIVFIVFVIYTEHKTTDNISGVVWITAIWILYSGSKGLGFFLNIRTTIETGSWPDRYFILSLAILSLIIIFKRQFPLLAAIKKNVPVALILVYSLISVGWSRDPGISFRRWGREAAALTIALLLCSENYPIRTLTSAFKKAMYAALPLSILLIKYYPDYGRSYGRWSGELMWDGIASQKNGMAMMCSLFILFLIWSFSRDLSNWKRLPSKLPVFIDIFMILLALYLMMGPRRTFTYSATSFVALITGIILLIFLKAAVKYGINTEKKIMILAIIIIFIGTFMPFTGKIPIRSLPKLLNRSETLTERTLIWNTLIPYAKRHILFGYGFGGFWTTSLRDQIASHSHNGYLDIILELGLLGLSLAVIFILTLIKKSLKLLSSESQMAFFSLSLILMHLVRNASEISLAEFTSNSVWLLLSWSFIIAESKDPLKLSA